MLGWRWAGQRGRGDHDRPRGARLGTLVCRVARKGHGPPGGEDPWRAVPSRARDGYARAHLPFVPGRDHPIARPHGYAGTDEMSGGYRHPDRPVKVEPPRLAPTRHTRKPCMRNTIQMYRFRVRRKRPGARHGPSGTGPPPPTLMPRGRGPSWEWDCVVQFLRFAPGAQAARARGAPPYRSLTVYASDRFGGARTSRGLVPEARVRHGREGLLPPLRRRESKDPRLAPQRRLHGFPNANTSPDQPIVM